jgi:X-linked retinitis pigmentosa GTPase regulator
VNNIVGPRVSYPKPARIEISKDSGSEDNRVGQEDEGHHEGDYVDHDDGEYKGNNDDGEYKGNNDDGEYKGHSGDDDGEYKGHSDDDDGEYKGHSDDDDGEYRGHNDEGKGRPQDDHTDQADGRLEAEMRRGGGQVVQRTGDLRKKEKQEKKAKEEEEESSDSDSSESEEEEEED